MRHAYSQSDRSSDHPGGGELMTKQSHKDECDVNLIVARHLEIGGVITPQEFNEEIVVLPENFDYKEALDALNAADEAFMKLPAEIRSAHDNNPGNLLNHLDSKAFLSGEVDIKGVARQPEVDPEASKPAEPTPDAQ
jgi:hypothetical protein